MPKQINLDEQDTLFYHPKKTQTEREKLSEMNFQGKLSYLWDYYKWYFMGAVAFIALVIYFVNTILHPTPSPQFYAAIINNSIFEEPLQKFKDDFAKELNLNPKRERVEFNTAINFDMAGAYKITMQEALTSYIVAKEVDVIIAPESIFKDYAYSETFKKLSDELPTNLYTSLTDQFYLSNTEADQNKKSVYGIYLTETKLFKENANNVDPYVLGIVMNSPHEENTLEFVKYIFDLK